MNSATTTFLIKSRESLVPTSNYSRTALQVTTSCFSLQSLFCRKILQNGGKPFCPKYFSFSSAPHWPPPPAARSEMSSSSTFPSTYPPPAPGPDCVNSVITHPVPLTPLRGGGGGVSWIVDKRKRQQRTSRLSLPPSLPSSQARDERQ